METSDKIFWGAMAAIYAKKAIERKRSEEYEARDNALKAAQRAINDLKYQYDDEDEDCPGFVTLEGDIKKPVQQKDGHIYFIGEDGTKETVFNNNGRYFFLDKDGVAKTIINEGPMPLTPEQEQQEQERIKRAEEWAAGAEERREKEMAHLARRGKKAKHALMIIYSIIAITIAVTASFWHFGYDLMGGFSLFFGFFVLVCSARVMLVYVNAEEEQARFDAIIKHEDVVLTPEQEQEEAKKNKDAIDGFKILGLTCVITALAAFLGHFFGYNMILSVVIGVISGFFISAGLFAESPVQARTQHLTISPVCVNSGRVNVRRRCSQDTAPEVGINYGRLFLIIIGLIVVFAGALIGAAWLYKHHIIN